MTLKEYKIQAPDTGFTGQDSCTGKIAAGGIAAEWFSGACGVVWGEGVSCLLICTAHIYT